MPNRAVFNNIIFLHPELNIDLFATRPNKQLEVYCSWKTDPGCAFVDDSVLTGENLSSMLSLIPSCVHKIPNDQAKGILIILVWPTETWFSKGPPVTLQPTMDYQTHQEPSTACSSQRTTSLTQPNTHIGLSTLRELFTKYHVSPDITKILHGLLERSYTEAIQNIH